MRAFKIIALDSDVSRSDLEFIKDKIRCVLLSLNAPSPQIEIIDSDNIEFPTFSRVFNDTALLIKTKTGPIFNAFILLNNLLFIDREARHLLPHWPPQSYLIGVTTVKLRNDVDVLGVARHGEGVLVNTLSCKKIVRSKKFQYNDRLNLAFTTIHELGHVLGLQGHCHKGCFMRATCNPKSVIKLIKQIETTGRFYCKRCNNFLLRIHNQNQSSV